MGRLERGTAVAGHCENGAWNGGPAHLARPGVFPLTHSKPRFRCPVNRTEVLPTCPDVAEKN